MTAYHGQQAAEKALKAFLTLRGTPFRLTHDLVELLAQCQALDAGVVRLTAAAQTLSPYATPRTRSSCAPASASCPHHGGVAARPKSAAAS